MSNSIKILTESAFRDLCNRCKTTMVLDQPMKNIIDAILKIDSINYYDKINKLVDELHFSAHTNNK